MTATAVLQLDRLSKHFGGVVAVDEITEAIGAGEYFCILGPSGCGKTTLLRLIAGFEEPTAGAVTLDGRTLAGVPPEKRDVNIVFQSYALFPHLNVFENVAFGLRARRAAAREVQERVRDALALVRLDAESERLPRQLSGGQQQRVALARALVMHPRVLLLDEPLSALDRHLRQAMQEELRRIQQQTALTFIHITHDQSEALALGSRVAVMRSGKFIQVAPPDELYRRPVNRFIAEFVGASNVFRATVASVEPPVIAAAGTVLQVRDLPGNARIGQPLCVSVRPEALHLDAAGFPARIVAVAFAGAALDITLDSGGRTWLAHVPARGELANLEPGAELRVSVAPQDVVILRDDA